MGNSGVTAARGQLRVRCLAHGHFSSGGLRTCITGQVPNLGAMADLMMRSMTLSMGKSLVCRDFDSNLSNVTMLE